MSEKRKGPGAKCEKSSGPYTHWIFEPTPLLSTYTEFESMA